MTPTAARVAALEAERLVGLPRRARVDYPMEVRRAVLAEVGAFPIPREPRWRPEPFSDAELVEEIEHIGGSDCPDRVAARFGYTPAGMYKRLRAAGRPDLASPFNTVALRNRREAS